MRIIPVNEPRGEGNGWDECPESLATGFEVDNGVEMVAFFDTKEQAEQANAEAQ